MPDPAKRPVLYKVLDESSGDTACRANWLSQAYYRKTPAGCTDPAPVSASADAASGSLHHVNGKRPPAYSNLPICRSATGCAPMAFLPCWYPGFLWLFKRLDEQNSSNVIQYKLYLIYSTRESRLFYE
jgi:hypothetical protein